MDVPLLQTFEMIMFRMSTREAGDIAKPISCTVKPAQLIRLGDIRTEFHSGCSIVEVTFPNVVYVEVLSAASFFLSLSVVQVQN